MRVVWSNMTFSCVCYTNFRNVFFFFFFKDPVTYSVNQMENMRVYALSALILVQEVSRNLNFFHSMHNGFLKSISTVHYMAFTYHLKRHSTFHLRKCWWKLTIGKKKSPTL